MNKRVYEAVAERAGNCCECCGMSGGVLELDHYEGRAVSETVETCWMLWREHHAQKTRHEPSAVMWALRFAQHCLRHGYVEAAQRALSSAEFWAVKSTMRAQP